MNIHQICTSNNASSTDTIVVQHNQIRNLVSKFSKLGKLENLYNKKLDILLENGKHCILKINSDRSTFHKKDNIKLGYYLPKKCETLNIIDVNIYESSSTKLF